MAASPRPDDLIGGRYRLEGTIASGGMADVWRGTDMKLGREVAVKLLKDSVAKDPTVAERFRREARSLARLTHPNIVAVYDCIEEDGQVALIMRLIHGKSLRSLLDEAPEKGQRAGTLSVHLTVHIGRSIAAALAKAHSENIVHRDIKPANILIMENGDVLLTDFGIAKPLKASEDDGTDLTRADIMMGTAKYLSPEQVQGRELDGRADIYALGLVLYECLAGEVPFRGENDQATAVARLQRDPTPLNGIRPDIPSTVVSVIHKMLRRRPENRFESCTEVSDALERALRHLHDAATPVDGVAPGILPSEPRRRESHGDPLMPNRRAGNSPRPRSSRTAKDPTPRGLPRGKASLPPAQRTSTRRNYIPIALILVAAAVMSGLLWNGLRNTTSSAIPSDPSTVVSGPVSITKLASYDPNGDDGQENENMIPALTDNNPATTWTTVCYGDKFFGSKGGVGIAMTLSGLGVGKVSATFANGPWSAEIYSFAGDAMPQDFDAWGLRVADGYGETGGAATFDVRTPGRYMLLVLREIGPNPTCSNANPYKGALSELTFTSTS